MVLMGFITYIRSPLGISEASLGYIGFHKGKGSSIIINKKPKTEIKTKNSNIHQFMLTNSHNQINHQRKHSISSYCYMFIVVQPPCYTEYVRKTIYEKNSIYLTISDPQPRSISLNYPHFSFFIAP